MISGGYNYPGIYNESWSVTASLNPGGSTTNPVSSPSFTATAGGYSFPDGSTLYENQTNSLAYSGSINAQTGSFTRITSTGASTLGTVSVTGLTNSGNEAISGTITAQTGALGRVILASSGTSGSAALTFTGNLNVGLFYDPAKGCLASANVASGSSYLAANNLVPYNVDTPVYYRFDDLDRYITLTTYFVTAGTVYASSNNGANSYLNTDHVGNVVVQTAGQYASSAFAMPINGNYLKSTSTIWQWRQHFMFPTQLSSPGNRYTFYVGSFYYSGGSLQAGPYISYCDNVNSGNWVLNSNYGAGALTTANTSIAVPVTATWHTLTISLYNGTFTYVLDGTTLGTLLDTNNSSTSMQWCTLGGAIALFPATYLSATYTFLDAFDCLVTGLGR